MENVIGRQRGPVELLCDEIGFRFRHSLETVQTLRAFTLVLVDEIRGMWHIAESTSQMTGQSPSDDSAAAIAKAAAMLTHTSRDQLISAAALVHGYCDEANPEGKYPTDHYIDMVSSCASILRFGLEVPCHSRHAAEAASHIWRKKYGVTLHDRHSTNWERDWARSVFEQALILQIHTLSHGGE